MDVIGRRHTEVRIGIQPAGQVVRIGLLDDGLSEVPSSDVCLPHGIPSDGFSVRWTGRVRAAATSAYLFQAQSDYSIRVILNGTSLLTNASGPTAKVLQAEQSLTAGQTYDLKVEYIGRARGQVAIGGTNEQEQTLNQILTEMDGFSSREGIIVLAATNQPEVLDKALLRPGRFDRRVVVNLPNKTGREAILKVHTRSVPLANDGIIGELAAATPGFSGADLRNLVNEAALLAARRGQNEVRHKDFLDALEKIVLGPERPLLLSHADKERIAYHEGGHAILGLVVPGADPVNRVTIVPHGQALGVTYQRPDTDRYNYPEAYLRARIVGMQGGRAAEEIVYGTKTTGAESDIDQASGLARGMVTRWGMSERLGLVQLTATPSPVVDPRPVAAPDRHWCRHHS